MHEPLKIKRALISVSCKDGLLDFAKDLLRHNIYLISTGGCAQMLKKAEIPATNVAEITNFPEIMDGRVKTLHPQIHGAILAKRSNTRHQAEMEAHHITPIDLVVINLYPFQETIKQYQSGNATIEDCIENIDIGGPAMIRAGAKNAQDVCVVTDIGDYRAIIEELDAKDGHISFDFRQSLAIKAYQLTSEYDRIITNWLGSANDHVQIKGEQIATMRYGENPHQSAVFYKDTQSNASLIPSCNLDLLASNAQENQEGIANARQLQGKQCSYNNIVDADCALKLVHEFTDPTCVIIKHATPCGVATGTSPLNAWEKALSSNPSAAFGGIVAFNCKIDETTAQQMTELFLEVIIAPSFSNAACHVLSNKNNLRLLEASPISYSNPDITFRSVSGGFLAQNNIIGIGDPAHWVHPCDKKATQEQINEASFAMRVAKYTRSNAIVISANTQSLGIGAGQTSRIEAAKIAIDQAHAHQKNNPLIKQDMLIGASDAFFPFPDALQLLADAGVQVIIHPGGSKNDADVIDAANQANIALIITGTRLFYH